MTKKSFVLSLIFLFLFSCFCFAQSKININKADVSKLMELKGIGKKYAERIVEYRNENGAFKKIEDLKGVKGIGEKIILKNKDLIMVTDQQ